MKTIALALACLMGTGTLAMAQEHDHGQANPGQTKPGQTQPGHMMGPGMMGGGMGMMGGMGPGMMGDMQTIHKLFANNKTFKRTIKNTPHGIEVTTDSSDPRVVPILQEHVAAMKLRLEKKQPIRQGDPLFAVLFENADKVKMTVENTKTGVKIIETSDDPYTVKILQAHAQAVSGFVKDGMPGMMQRHPAPLRDGEKQAKEPQFIGKGDGVKTCPVMGGPVDAKVSVRYKGKTVKFCCPSCKATFLKAPERYLK